MERYFIFFTIVLNYEFLPLYLSLPFILFWTELVLSVNYEYAYNLNPITHTIRGMIAWFYGLCTLFSILELFKVLFI